MTELDYNISLDIATGLYLHSDEETFPDDRYTDDLNYDDSEFLPEIEEIIQADNLEDVSRFSLFIPLQKQEYDRNKSFDYCQICRQCDEMSDPYGCGNYKENYKCAVNTQDLNGNLIYGNLTFCEDCYSEIDGTRKYYLSFYVKKFMFLKNFANLKEIFDIISEVFILVCRAAELKSTHFVQSQLFKIQCYTGKDGNIYKRKY